MPGPLLERLGLELPIVQAGMGGGVARSELAAAVSEAGGLGTLGIMPPGQLQAELNAVRERTSNPVAVNLLLPFARRGHWAIAERADVVVTFWGRPRRRTRRPWFHQCGSVEEAREAHRAGADAVIAQGIEAGGHVRGTTPALELLARTREALPRDYPILVAGGVADAADVGAALDAGAAAAVLGTRFLLSEESRAHPQYKKRVCDAGHSILTELFGAGWPAPHRVVANAATERWLQADHRGPAWVLALNRATSPLLSRADWLGARLAGVQRPNLPLLSPQPPTDDGPPTRVDSGPLYAGETAARIDDVRPAGFIVRELAY